MASKKSAIKNPQSAIIKALVAAGYTLDGFERKPGSNLIIRLTPTILIEEGRHVAEIVCAANNLQARCRVFPQVPKDLLIVTIKLPADSTEPTADSSQPTAKKEHSS